MELGRISGQSLAFPKDLDEMPVVVAPYCGADAWHLPAHIQQKPDDDGCLPGYLLERYLAQGGLIPCQLSQVD